MEYRYKFCKNLKELRELSGLTLKQVASKIGIKYQSYQAYEQGFSVPSFDHLMIIADLFDVELDELVGRKGKY